MGTPLSEARADKKKIKTHKTIWLIIWAINLIVTIGFIIAGFYMWVVMLYISIFLFSFFISALLLSCRVYDFNGNIITVYAGWFHHYLKVNGKVMDENNTLISFSPIYLSTNLPDGTYLHATITTMNRVSLKINNVLYTVEIKNP